MRAAPLGAILVFFYTGMMAAADGITKFIAGGYAAPQLFALSSALVVAFSALAAGLSGDSVSLRVACKKAMLLRSVLTVIAALAFFKAFGLLPFAEVFVFIGLMPLIAAALSGPVLGERPRALAWVALAIGASGVFCLAYGGAEGTRQGSGAGYIWAAVAALTGTGSMLLARLIARHERVPLAQVFWPNLALMIAMGFALPFVWRPMSVVDTGWVIAYAVFLFGARYVVAEALRLLPAYIATPLMNLQFVWMVIIGVVFFGEFPTTGTFLGVVLVIGSGLWMVAEQNMQWRSFSARRAMVRRRLKYAK